MDRNLSNTLYSRRCHLFVVFVIVFLSNLFVCLFRWVQVFMRLAMVTPPPLWQFRPGSSLSKVSFKEKVSQDIGNYFKGLIHGVSALIVFKRSSWYFIEAIFWLIIKPFVFSYCLLPCQAEAICTEERNNIVEIEINVLNLNLLAYFYILYWLNSSENALWNTPNISLFSYWLNFCNVRPSLDTGKILGQWLPLWFF